MSSSRKSPGQHRLKKQASNTRGKRALSVTAAALAVTGGVQIANATASSASPYPWGTYLQPLGGSRAMPVIYYGFHGAVDGTTRSAVDRAARIWNAKLGTDLLRPAGPGQYPSLMLSKGYLNGGYVGWTQLSNCYGGACRQGDITLSPSWFDGWRRAENSPLFTRQVDTVVHELGHALGLGHSTGGWDQNNPGNPDEIMRPTITTHVHEPSGPEVDAVSRYYHLQPRRPGTADPQPAQPENRRPAQPENRRPAEPEKEQYRQTQFYIQHSDGTWHDFKPGSPAEGYRGVIGWGLDSSNTWREITNPRSYLHGAGADSNDPAEDQRRADEQRQQDERRADEQRQEDQRCDEGRAER